MKIVCFGPGPAFKGGISNYNTSLAKALEKSGAEVHIVSWTQQYPAIIPRQFKDLTSKTDLLAGTRIKTRYITNYNNPLTWNATVDYIKKLKPSKVIFQWSIAVQGIPLGYIARQLMNVKGIEVVFDLHFVIQKENSSLDKKLTKYGISNAHTYITHAEKTFDELKEIFPEKHFYRSQNGERAGDNKQTVIKLFHPVYDLFKVNPDFDVEAFKKEHGLKKYVFLFFGFIRKYKGLHYAIPAFKELADKRDDVSLIVCGESFWQTVDQSKFSTKIKNLLFGAAKKLFLKKGDDEKNYNPLELIGQLGLEKKVLINNEYVPNEDVHKYFQVSDAVVLFYEYATPSGVESLSYNFRLPILATKVGHFPETVKDGYNGYLADPADTHSMAYVMDKFISNPIHRENIEETTREMSWENYARYILAG